MDVCGQPVCILQIGRMLLKCAVNHICYIWLCGFNSQVRMNFLSYNLICSSAGMLGSYMNFMNWFLYDLGAECVWWLYYVFWGTLCDGNRIFLVLRYRFWDEYVIYDKELWIVISFDIWFRCYQYPSLSSFDFRLSIPLLSGKR